MISLFLPFAFLALASSSPQMPASTTPTSFEFTTGAADSGPAVCYKMRSYIFARNDDAAPKLVRETTCSTARPRLNRSKMPKARIVPAN